MLAAASDPGSSPRSLPLPVRLLVAVVAGWALFELSCWLVPPAPMVKGFGEQWQAMSADPLSFPGGLAHRILGPLLAWLFGQGGEGWLGFTHLLHVVLLASVCFVALHLRARVVDAVLVAAAVAITAPVQEYKLHWSGYADPLCYSLFLWAIVAARNPYAFWALFLANLLNHELAGFLLPWLWFLRRQQDRRWRLDLVLSGCACAIYLAYYLWVRANYGQQFSIDYFVGHPLFPGGSFIVWNLAVVHVVTTFGPLLAVLAWQQHGRGVGWQRLHLWLVALGCFVIFCIAFDWQRHSNLIVLPLVLASVRMLQAGNAHRVAFVALLAVSLLIFWRIEPWDPLPWPTDIFLAGTEEWRAANPGWKPPVGMLLRYKIVLIEPGTTNVFYGSLGTVLSEWLPRIWKPLLAVHACALAIWGLGFALSRKLPARRVAA